MKSNDLECRGSAPAVAVHVIWVTNAVIPKSSGCMTSFRSSPSRPHRRDSLPMIFTLTPHLEIGILMVRHAVMARRPSAYFAANRGIQEFRLLPRYKAPKKTVRRMSAA